MSDEQIVDDLVNKSVLNFIRLIRESHPIMVKIFTQGSCMNFHYILAEKFHTAIPYYDSNHYIYSSFNQPKKAIREMMEGHYEITEEDLSKRTNGK